MQGNVVIGIGAFTPMLAMGAFRAAALVYVVAVATGTAGDWLHEHLYRRGRWRRGSAE